MTRFEPKPSGIGSDHSANCAQPLPMIILILFKNLDQSYQETFLFLLLTLPNPGTCIYHETVLSTAKNLSLLTVKRERK